MNLHDIITLQDKLRTIYKKHKDIDTLDALLLVGKIRREIEEETPMKH